MPLGVLLGVVPVRLFGTAAGGGICILFLLRALPIASVSRFVPVSVPDACGAPIDAVLEVRFICVVAAAASALSSR